MPCEDHAFVALAFGDSPFLDGCLASLRAQTCAGRIVVATSTPSEAVARAARRAEAELIVNPIRQSIGTDWNFALAATDARYVTLAHQDDVYDPGFLARTRDLFAQRPDAALCFTGYREITDAGHPRLSKTAAVKTLIKQLTIGSDTIVSGRRLRALLSFGNPIPCSSVTINRDAVGSFAFSETLASNLDWEAWWRLSQADRTVLHCPEPLVGRRYNAQSATYRLIHDGRRQQEDRLMFETIWPGAVARAIAFVYRAGY